MALEIERRFLIKNDNWKEFIIKKLNWKGDLSLKN